MTEERRDYQRLNLTKPIDGWLGDFSVQLTEVSARGAQILHEDELPDGARALLRFMWRGEELELLAEIVHSMGQRSGLRFIDDNARLRDLIRQSAEELLRAQQANAEGDRD